MGWAGVQVTLPPDGEERDVPLPAQLFRAGINLSRASVSHSTHAA
jgi:hypothetical protein